MSDATLRRLTELAGEMSTAVRKVSPMQVAAQLLEEAVGRVGVKTETHIEEISADPKVGPPPNLVKIQPSRGNQAQEEGRQAAHRRKEG